MMMPNFVFCEAFESHLPEEYKDQFSEVVGSKGSKVDLEFFINVVVKPGLVIPEAGKSSDHVYDFF